MAGRALEEVGVAREPTGGWEGKTWGGGVVHGGGGACTWARWGRGSTEAVLESGFGGGGQKGRRVTEPRRKNDLEGAEVVCGPDEERPTGRGLEELEAGAGSKDDSKGGALKGGDQSHGS